jgi:arsenate reductase
MPDAAGTRVTPKLRVLFLCTGNSGRSQMAEGWARHLKGEVIDAYSAGTHPKGLDPLAVQVMAEVGVDLSTHQVKSLDAVRYLPFDYVVTVCRDAHETCPVFPGRARIVHRGFDDPPRPRAPRKPCAITCACETRSKPFLSSCQKPCSDREETPMNTTPESEATRDPVRERYADIARATIPTAGSTSPRISPRCGTISLACSSLAGALPCRIWCSCNLSRPPWPGSSGRFSCALKQPRGWSRERPAVNSRR